MFAYTLTPESVNLLIGGKPRTVHKSHMNYAAILEMLKDPARKRFPDIFQQGLLDMIDVRSFIARVTEGRVQVSDDTVLFNGQKAHGVIRDRLLTHLAEGFDIRPLARFLDKLMENPTESSRDDLYLWLENSKMPICEDGDFLAYKYVNGDYTSSHDRTTMHTIGGFVEMAREECDTDRHNTCSTGLHFCSYDYMSGFASGGDRRQLILKINPRDVTAIPSDYGNAKGRACRYEVIGEVETEQKFPPLVKAYGTYVEEFETFVARPADFVEPVDDHFDHQGCGCGTDDEPDDLATRSVTGDDRIYDKPPPIPKTKPQAPATTTRFQRHKLGPSWSASKLRADVDKLGQRGFSKKHGVPRSTLQGWLRSADAAIVNEKRRK